MSSKFELALAAAEAAAASAAAAHEDHCAATREAISAEYNEIEARAAERELTRTDAAVALAVKYKKDPKTGKCKIEGCEEQLVSRRLKYLWPFKPFVDKKEKHHCRSCKLKVCEAHFARSPRGMKVCTVCLAAGVDGPDLGKAEDEDVDEEELGAVAGAESPAPSGGSGVGGGAAAPAQASSP